jgi:SOS response regulatory protein OraA/RecX
MAKTTNKKVIENVIADVYGVNALNCDAIVVEWAAGRLEETHGADVAASEWRRLNARRVRLGLYTTIPQWGSTLWTAFFAARAA